MIKVCISCGKEYSTYHKEQKYCSKSCARKGKGNPRKEHNCIICGSPCKGHRAPCGKMRYPKTCCDECAGTLWNEKIIRHFEKTLATREKAFAEKFNTKFAGRFVYIGGYKNCESIITCKCLICGHEETITAQCVRNKKTGNQYIIKCGGCREIERDEAERVKTEEKEKRVEEREKIRNEHKELRRIEHEKRLTKQCAECGETFIAYGGTSYCSDECRRRNSNRKRELKKRRVYANGKVDTNISLKKLAKRDNYKCQLCGGIVDMSKDTNDNWYGSIDHIVPISKGGTHTWGNVHLAHRYCNTVKNDERRWIFIDGNIKKSAPPLQVVAP